MEETLTREFFMQNTGVYSTHSNFALIKLEFEESKLTPDAFCQQYVKQNPIFTINLSGQIKIDASDDSLYSSSASDDIEETNAIDIIEGLSKSEYFWKSKCEELYECYKETADALNKSQSLLEEMKRSNNDFIAISKELCDCIMDKNSGGRRKFGQYGLPQ